MPPVPLSPLRYPGGKTRFVPHLVEWIGDTTYPSVVEPFCGGASVSLGLLKEDVVRRAVIGDADHLLADFWSAATLMTEELIEYMHSEPVTVKRWKHWKALESKDILTNAMKTLFLNRTSFSGLIRHGSVLGGVDQDAKIAAGEKVAYPVGCRFNKDTLEESIRRIGQWARQGRLMAVHSDYRDTLGIADDDGLVYLDPPYVEKSNQLYGKTFAEECHRDTARHAYKVAAKGIGVVVSYDDVPLIRELYSDSPFHVHEPKWAYGMGKSKSSRELLLTNIAEKGFA